ncbi:MAG: PEP-CTERM sorting domain-containing protein [Akkermansia sp.]|nr:PEP-CTERM sorting domain-containing protein [Akkermansia sp.]
MKKTIITLLAICGVAGAAPLTLPGTDDFTWIAGSNASGIGTGSSAEIIQNLAAAITADNIGNTDLTGWFGGTGQAYGQESDNEITITATNSFTFVSRPSRGGEYVALGVSLEEAASAITLTFTSDKKAGYSLWSYDATDKTATELIATTGLTTAGTVKETYNTADVNPSTLFVVWTANPSTGAESDGARVTISDIALSYTAVPEPTTATLSLLALAGLAARRRRASR